MFPFAAAAPKASWRTASPGRTISPGRTASPGRMTYVRVSGGAASPGNSRAASPGKAQFFMAAPTTRQRRASSPAQFVQPKHALPMQAGFRLVRTRSPSRVQTMLMQPVLMTSPGSPGKQRPGPPSAPPSAPASGRPSVVGYPGMPPKSPANRNTAVALSMGSGSPRARAYSTAKALSPQRISVQPPLCASRGSDISKAGMEGVAMDAEVASLEAEVRRLRKTAQDQATRLEGQGALLLGLRAELKGLRETWRLAQATAQPEPSPQPQVVEVVQVAVAEEALSYTLGGAAPAPEMPVGAAVPVAVQLAAPAPMAEAPVPEPEGREVFEVGAEPAVAVATAAGVEYGQFMQPEVPPAAEQVVSLEETTVVMGGAEGFTVGGQFTGGTFMGVPQELREETATFGNNVEGYVQAEQIDITTGMVPGPVLHEATTTIVSNGTGHGLAGGFEGATVAATGGRDERFTFATSVVNGKGHEPSGAQDNFIFTVQLDKGTGVELGLELDEETLQVTMVDEGGLIADWNRAHPEKSILPGARILEVNHQHSVDMVLERLVCDTVLDMTLSRS